MDYQLFVDYVWAPCCVLSVEKMPDGAYGNIRIICANAPYKRIMGPRYHDNMIYSELVPKDIKFEDFCYRAAVLGQRLHTYVETKALNCWTDQTLTPLNSDDENLGYCQFTFEFTHAVDPARMASVSVDNAEAVIKACVTLLQDRDFKENVGEVLQDILNISNAYSCRVVLIDHKRRMAPNFCERLKDSPVSMGLPAGGVIPYDVVKTWEGMIGVSNAVIVKNEFDMNDLERRNPSWVGHMRSYRVTSLILIPLRRGKNVIGYLYITNFDVEKVVQLKELVEIMAFILGSEISNHLLMDKLEIMSHTDELTGMQNRNAMIPRLSTLGDTPFGILNLDLNGLKTVNDTQGHEAGDRLLIQAAELLNEIFRQEEIYRTGGDEFIIICSGIAREVFERKVETLRDRTEQNVAVSFAMGSCWSDGSVDAQSAYRRADERMYSNKKQFYEDHPELPKRA